MKSKLKHPYMLLFFLSLSVPLFQECRDEKALNKGENQEKLFEIIQDRDFKNGLAITGNSSFHPEPIGYLYPFGKSGKETNWVLAQWGTRNILNDINPITSNDTVIYQQEAKRLFFYPQNNGNTLIGLEVFASKEYSAPRKEGESWVHLLIEQGFPTPIRLSTYNSIDYKIKARLLFCKNKMGDDYVKNLHTAQITFYLGIQNKTKDSPKYGDFFWFGLPLFDARESKIPENSTQDLGQEGATQKFISTVASSELFSGTMHTFNWISIEKDIYPWIKRSFEKAQNRGYMKGSKWDDLCITSMNLGWEVPGTFDCGIIFECPSLMATMNN